MSARHYPLHQVLDINGNPIGTGTVSAYEASTTTPKKIYTTRADAIADTNGATSITLPADASMIIWFDDATRLKLVIAAPAGQTISNATIDEISGEFDLSTSGLTLGGVLNLAQSANVASASTTNIASGAGVTGNYIVITGTTTITAFGTVQAGAERLLQFASALTITYNATSMILPGSANVTVAAGDFVRMLSLGGGNWTMVGWFAKDGHDIFTRKGADIASATTTNLATATGDFIDVTGTTTITGFGTAPAGIRRLVRFTGALLLTHNATSLILKGGANITTIANQFFEFVSLGSGNWAQVSETAIPDGTQINRTSANIASAGTTDLSTSTGNDIAITGTTTITAFGTVAAGIIKNLNFTGALTITHNGTSLILPGAQNILTIAGDRFSFISLGSGNWALYAGRIPVEGNHINIKGADIASAGTTDLATTTGDFVTVTGTTTITSLGTLAAGIEKTLHFSGALTFTHNGTSLILPGAANITTRAGDVAVVRSLGSGNWRCVNYTRGDSFPGIVVQQVRTITGAVATGTTVIPQDDTIPQITEGDQYMTLAITPKNAANILVIEVVTNSSHSAAVPHSTIGALFQDATANALAASMSNSGQTSGNPLAFTHTMAAGTTSSTTFRVRVGEDVAGTTTFNGGGAARKLGGVMASSIVITEYSV